jgi:beta-glucanase (GH16 family)
MTINIKTLWRIFQMVMVLITSIAYAQPPSSGKWKLAWSDEFNSEVKLDKDWTFQNGPSSHILCSRWRENAEIAHGVLRLVNKKERRAEQEWTSASLHTNNVFGYGYYECRYKYGNAPALNNSFWLMTSYNPQDSTQFEIDINEGHYPNEVATNIHRHHPLPHISNSRLMRMGHQTIGPEFNLVLEDQIMTDRIRLTIRDEQHISLAELGIYSYNSQKSYPKLASNSLVDNNLARSAQVKVNGMLRPEFSGNKATDGDLNTRWVSNDNPKPYTIELDWNKPQPVGCVQWLSGYPIGNERKSTIQNYMLEYWDGKAWVTIQKTTDQQIDLINTYHIYGFDWNEKEMVWYFDGKEIRREPNVFCHQLSPIYLSSAIIKWSGPVTEQINGTSMDVDYVRYYQKK